VSGQALKARSRLRAERAGRAQERAGRRRAARRRLSAVLPALAGVVLVVAGCSSGGGTTHASGAAAASPTGTASSPAPVSHNLLRLVVPPGPVQNGNVISQVDWVTPFQKQTGCQVYLTNANSDAEAAKDITRGGSYYSGVLASPELAGQLISAKAAAPLNTALIPGYPALGAALRTAPSGVSGGKTYAVPYAWDSYVTGYDASKVKPAPQDWSALFAPASAARYAGKITMPDSVATIALAALYLKSAQPSLGITDPFELDQAQFAAATQAVNAVRHNIGTFWSQDSTVIGQLGDGQDVLGAVMTHQIGEMARAGLPAAGVPAQATAARPGATIGYVQSWLMSAHAGNPGCMYRWMSWTASKYVQERMAAWTGTAPVNPAACTGPAAAICAAFHETNLASARNMTFEHLPLADCGNGHTTCLDYAHWRSAWDKIAS
jgi:putative spermidine/putrescine transport system substrate-binding protein